MTLSPAGIDINMGCPVSKVLKHNWGVALMGDIRYAEEVVRTTRRLTSLPLSVKMRTGLKDDPEYLVDFARMLEQAGADWVTLHPPNSVSAPARPSQLGVTSAGCGMPCESRSSAMGMSSRPRISCGCCSRPVATA